ncbi:MAG: T9SS type A sorting domain-containing protein [Bacteroidales bacterium]
MHPPIMAFRRRITFLSSLLLSAVLAGQVPNIAASVIQQGSGATTTVPLIRLAACYSETPDYLDYTVIYFDDKATYEFDGQLDALKLMNTDIGVPNLYTRTPGGASLSINALPPAAKTQLKVALGLKTGAPGFVKFNISEIDTTLSKYRVYLTDTATGAEHNLLPVLEHEIYLPAGDYAGRFYINVSALSPAITRNYSDVNHFNIYRNSGALTAVVNSLAGRDGILTVFDLTGKAHHEVRLAGPGQYELRNNFKEGIYIVSLVSGGTRSTRKIFINNQSL